MNKKQQLRQLEDKLISVSDEISKLKGDICADILKSLGLKIGDKVQSKRHRHRKGILTKVIYSSWNKSGASYETSQIKKDGTQSMNNIHLSDGLNELIKIEEENNV